jgi:octanoyl-[GcvH]:protein N-octanoyltransferase
VRCRLRLLDASFPDRPAFDMAVSAALLQRVAAGELEPTLRLHRQRPAVAFGKLDVLEQGFDAAVAAVRARGYEPFERLAGGRAAVYHEGTFVIGEVLADPDANVHIQERYAATADVLVEALTSLGVDARVGAVAGEYCPGDFSVNARGQRKLTGTAQRVVRGGAYVGTVIVVRDAAAIADVVRDAYAELGLDVAPETTGAVEDEAPGVTVDDMERALVAAYGARHALEPAELDEPTLTLAAELEPRFRVRVGTGAQRPT